MKKRLKPVNKILKSNKLDALLISSEANISYLSGFSGNEGVLLVSAKENLLITDFRYKYQAKEEAIGFKIKVLSGLRDKELPRIINKIAKHLCFKKIGFESRHLSWAKAEAIQNHLKVVEFVPTANIVENLREVKDKAEIKIIEQAASLASNAFNYVSSIINPGMSEKELSNEIEYFLRSEGAESSAFNIIVASGKNSAFPHAKTTGKIINKNDSVLVDIGANLKGYNSDLTRVLFLGRITRKLKKIYRVVKVARSRALSKIKAGCVISTIDKAARNYINNNGLGKFFGHALGHGIGKEVHECPVISSQNHNKLKVGMIVTVEPGVYIPGMGGVRIEDMVLVTKNGYRILTQ